MITAFSCHSDGKEGGFESKQLPIHIALLEPRMWTALEYVDYLEGYAKVPFNDLCAVS